MLNQSLMLTSQGQIFPQTSTFAPGLVPQGQFLGPTMDPNFLNPLYPYSQPLGSVLSPFISIGADKKAEIGYFIDLNKDPDVQFRFIEYYFRHTYEDWIPKGDMRDLLNYLNVSGDKVSIVKTEKEYEANKAKKESEGTMDKKIEFLKNEIMNHTKIAKILEEYVDYKNVNWYDLKEYKDNIHKYIKKYLTKKLRKNIA